MRCCLRGALTQRMARGTELFGGGVIDERVDQYAFGVVLCEMLTGSVPWKGMVALQIIMSVAVQKERPPIPRSCVLTPRRGLSCCVGAHAASPTHADARASSVL